MQQTFELKVRYTFEGYFIVRAASEKDAARLVSERCGVMRPSIRCELDENICPDWCLSLHPDMRIFSVKRFRRDK